MNRITDTAWDMAQAWRISEALPNLDDDSRGRLLAAGRNRRRMHLPGLGEISFRQLADRAPHLLSPELQAQVFQIMQLTPFKRVHEAQRLLQQVLDRSQTRLTFHPSVAQRQIELIHEEPVRETLEDFLDEVDIYELYDEQMLADQAEIGELTIYERMPATALDVAFEARAVMNGLVVNNIQFVDSFYDDMDGEQLLPVFAQVPPGFDDAAV